MSRREAIQRAAAVLGVALSPSILAGGLRAQNTPVEANVKPRYLSAVQFAAVAAIAERILPRTDTPGAIDVGVPIFIDLIFGEYLTTNERRTLAEGLADADATSSTTYGRTFAQLPASQQDDLLKRIAVASQGKEKTFFHLIRELVVTGYFTSEPVGKKVLHYDPIPGRYEACIPLAEVGNVTWTR